MKIAFIGSHGVGKTTLCFDLAAHLKRLDYSVDLVKEVARYCPLPINRETTLDAQAWILHTQIAQELASTSLHEIVVCDRSVLDNYAYLVHKVGRRRDLDPLVSAWLPGYTALVKVPIWRSPAFDGVRDVGREFQLGIDETIETLIDAFDVDVLRLDAETAPDWTPIILDHLNLSARAEQVSLFSEDE